MQTRIFRLHHNSSRLTRLLTILFVIVQVLQLANAIDRPTAASSTDRSVTIRSTSSILLNNLSNRRRAINNEALYRNARSTSTTTSHPSSPIASGTTATSTIPSTITTTSDSQTSASGEAVYVPIVQPGISNSSSGSAGSSSKLRKRADKLHPSSAVELTFNRSTASVPGSNGGGSGGGVGLNGRESLAHEGSDQVVYVSDTAGYIPVTPIRSRLPPPPSAGYHSGGVPLTGPAVELEPWRPEVWDRDYGRRFRYNNTRVQHIEAECQDDYMKIRVGFNGSFAGLLYSAGYAYDPDCMYVNGSGRDYYEFFIQLNRCGTLGKNSHHDDGRKNPTNFMWNTITVQYNPLIEEEFDEHFKVTCEYGYDFWKTVTFPFLDVEVATGNPVVFTLSPPECYMEIRTGYGVTGTRVSGPVRVGDPLTLIIYMRSKYDGFDIVVNDCVAHNGANKRIQLIDDYGCPVDDKLISRFRGSWSESAVYETQVYAYMKTFRFTGSPALYIECDVRMCHGRCPSQPCHWRNLKSVAKREVGNGTQLENSSKDESAKQESISDNISLFQSLRVLQEEDEDYDSAKQTDTASVKVASETCLRTTTLSGVLVALTLVICVMTASLLTACAKLRSRNKGDGVYDTYVNHKGQID